MANSITSVTPEIASYIIERFGEEDEFLYRLREEAVEQDIPEIHISPEQGRFLQFQLRAIGARTVVEIGSLAGYSAIQMARALPDGGVIHCLELNEDYCDFIRRKAHQAGLSDRVRVHAGPALLTLAALQLASPIDFVFIDADKPNYLNYFNAVLPLVRSGGIICADNTLAWGEIANPETEYEPHNVRALQEYNRVVSSHPDVLCTLVPLGDGMTLALKREV